MISCVLKCLCLEHHAHDRDVVLIHGKRSMGVLKPVQEKRDY